MDVYTTVPVALTFFFNEQLTPRHSQSVAHQVIMVEITALNKSSDTHALCIRILPECFNYCTSQGKPSLKALMRSIKFYNLKF